jgi:hypothetical protein
MPISWVFVWLLAVGGFQFSPEYSTQAACETVRQQVEASKVDPERGRPIEKTYACLSLKRSPTGPYAQASGDAQVEN